MDEKKKQSSMTDNGYRFVWPDLVIKELIAMIVVMIILVFFALKWDAPLRELANPGITENPAKAPWYFLGLQELLVYFDPWIAGVVLPTLIIFGLMLIPYLDNNPLGGKYTFSARKFAMINYLFGYGLWFVLIFIGTFMRGPNWQWYWPWESWDVPKHLEEKLIMSPDEVLFPGAGILLVLLYFLLGFILPWFLKKDFFRRLGFPRYAVLMTFFLLMYGVPIKIILRLFFNLRYILVTPWFNI
jgi:hypothetical protein